MMNPLTTATVSLELDASVTRVWKAITDPAEVKQYFFGTDLVTNWEVGQPIFFRGAWEGQAYEDKGTVLQFEPEKMLQYDYYSSFSELEDLPEHYQTITYTVAPKGTGTLLTVVQTNLPGKEQKEHSEQNWLLVLEAMKKLVEG